MKPQKAKGQADGPALLAALENFMGIRYAELPKGMPFVLALYAVMTHCFEVLDALAYIAVTSPTKCCGKTRLLELLSFACARAISTVGISPAALFRTIDEKKPTLLVDESETLSGKTEKAEALREVANAGYKRGQKVRRCEGKRGGYQVKEFEVFGPKIFALIGKLPVTLADRSIETRMQRSRKRLARYRRAHVEPEGRALHEQTKAWVAAHQDEIKAWYESHDLEFLEGRNEELWLPLFAVCHVMAPDRTKELEAIACECTRTKQAGESDDIALRLLSHIREVFSPSKQAEMASVDLCEALNADPELPYISWNNGKGIQPYDLARRLGPFGIQSRNLRFGEHVKKGYARQEFERAWETYLPPWSRYTATKGIDTGENGDLAPATEGPRSGTENALAANEYAGCSDVAGEKGL